MAAAIFIMVLPLILISFKKALETKDVNSGSSPHASAEPGKNIKETNTHRVDKKSAQEEEEPKYQGLPPTVRQDIDDVIAEFNREAAKNNAAKGEIETGASKNNPGSMVEIWCQVQLLRRKRNQGLNFFRIPL